MIHRNDERVFRAIELTCYVVFFAVAVMWKTRFGRSWPYSLPLVFITLSSTGLAYLTRFFIYAHPEKFLDRTRAPEVSIPKSKRGLLVLGYAMCIPMFGFGSIGLIDPQAMNRVIIKVSPFRILLADGQESLVFLLAMVGLASVLTIVGAMHARRLMWVGISAFMVIGVYAFALLR